MDMQLATSKVDTIKRVHQAHMMSENIQLQNSETNVLRLQRELEAVQKEHKKKLEDLVKVTRRKETLE
jgi:hypothetical protein